MESHKSSLGSRMNQIQKLGSFCLVIVALVLEVHGTQDLIIGLLVPETIQGIESLLGLQAYEALLMAVDDINNSSTILPHYQLSTIYNNSGCAGQTAIASTLWQLVTYPNVTAFVGAGCTIDAESISLLSGVYSVPTISYDASGQHNYPTFLRVVPPDSLQVKGWVAISKYYGWKRVGILTTTENLNLQFIDAFTKVADKMQLVPQTFISGTDVTIQLTYIKNQGCRIIFLACDYMDTAKIFLSALEVGMVGAEYVWIGSDSWMEADFWVESLQNITLQTIVKNSVRGSIGLVPAVGNSSRTEQFLRGYVARTNWTRPNNYAFFAYDAMWTLGHALHQMIEVQGEVPAPTELFKLKLLQQLKSTSFEGVTAGRVEFQENGDRLGPYNLMNFRPDGSLMTVGIYDPQSDTFYEHTQVIWYNGTEVPKDRPNTCTEESCEFICTDTTTGPVCSCLPGYSLREDQKSCLALPCDLTSWSAWHKYCNSSCPSTLITRSRGYNNSVIQQTSPLCYDARLNEHLKVFYVDDSYSAILCLEEEWQDWLPYQLFDMYQFNSTIYDVYYTDIFIKIAKTNETCDEQLKNLYSEKGQKQFINWASLVVPNIAPSRYNFSMDVKANYCMIVMTIKMISQEAQTKEKQLIIIGVVIGMGTFISLALLLLFLNSERFDLSSLPSDIRKIMSDNLINSWTKLPRTGIYVRDLSQDNSKWLRGILEEHLDGEIIPILKFTKVFNPALISAFINKRKLMITRAINYPNLFCKESWRNRDPGNIRSIIRQHYYSYVQNFSWNVGEIIPIVPMLYATDEELAEKICNNGFTTLAIDDNCFYGQGIYLTTSAKYALAHCKEKDKRALLFVFVMPGNVYPTIETPYGEQSLEGMPIMSGYQSHYVLTDSNRLPSLPSSTMKVYSELVIGEETQVLPIIILYLQCQTLTEQQCQTEESSYDYHLLENVDVPLFL